MACGRFSLLSRVASFRFAFRGLLTLVRAEPNARIHVLATTTVLVLAALVEVSRPEWALLVLAIASVWTAEAMNAAVERLGDAVSADPHPLVGTAKDLAAGGVLASAIGAAVVGVLVLGPHLVTLLWP